MDKDKEAKPPKDEPDSMKNSKKAGKHGRVWNANPTKITLTVLPPVEKDSK